MPNRKKVEKLTTTQVEKMIGKMHANNRAKHEEAIRIQNEGLKSELEGYEFKPRINQTSLDLAATMKPIAERMPEMVAEKQRILARKREDRDKEEQATASFKPTRQVPSAAANAVTSRPHHSHAIVTLWSRYSHTMVTL